MLAYFTLALKQLSLSTFFYYIVYQIGLEDLSLDFQQMLLI